MPELPEVETIKEDLRGLVVGSGIEGAEVLDPALVEQPSPEEFVRRLEGVRVTGARRRAKHLIVELDSGDSLVFQLKIGGQLLLVPPVEEPRSSLMLVLHLSGDRRLFLRDQTGFSRARLLDADELEEEWASLHAAIRENLAAGIEHRGTTVRLYRDVLDRPGEHQNYLRVFEKHGELCPGGCGGEVVRERVGGRPTHYCPGCQRLSGGGEEQRLTFA
ncbi:MAG: hypothetical protein LC704_03640 [Actinobacteria bacterium]|nr:hypothetical protein [Actinomycetota bacterium]